MSISLESSHYLATPRLEFHYRTSGETDGLPILLIHGSYATSRWWQPLMSVFPVEILAVAPDLRGVGGTERAAAGYEISSQSEDIAAFIDTLGWQDFDIVAHSSGGAIAIEYILTHPDKARTLTLVDSVPLEGVYTPLDTYVILEKMRSDRELLAHAIHALMPSFSVVESEASHYFNQLVEDALEMSEAAFTALADALGQWNRFGDSQNLRIPTLLVWGDQDIIVDRDSTTRTFIAIPGANQLEVIRNVGHSPMIEAPVALAERLIEFITDDFDDFGEIRRIAVEDASENAQD